MDSKDQTFLKDKHISYILGLENTVEKDEVGYFISEYLRVSAGYWGLGTLSLCNHPIEAKKEDTLNLLKKSYTSSGGFGGYIGHDPCLRSTHYGMLQLALYDSLSDKSIADKDKIAEYVAHLQKSDGSFMGDDWGEVDIQFSYHALCTLALLDKLSLVNTEKACEYVLRCYNPDGAFGIVPGGESHAAYTFCAIAILSLLHKLDLVDRDKLEIGRAHV